jgi:hypothetical protein
MIQIPNDLFFSWVESEIAKGHSAQFRSKGVSMYPLIDGDRDEILLSPCSSKELAPMDVVLFKYRGKHILHRIIRREGHALTMQGDGAYVAKEECTVDDVIGKVRGIIRPSGKMISVDSWRWKVPSYLWCKMGQWRKPILRILHYMIRVTNLKDKKI